MKTWFKQPVVWVVVSSLSWRFLLTREASWREVSIIGLGVNIQIGGWSKGWGILHLWK